MKTIKLYVQVPENEEEAKKIKDRDIFEELKVERDVLKNLKTKSWHSYIYLLEKLSNEHLLNTNNMKTTIDAWICTFSDAVKAIELKKGLDKIVDGLEELLND